MSNIIVAATAAAVAGASLWGWGWAVRRCARALPLPHALTIAVGLAAVLSLGGVLNVAKLVHPAALDAIVVVGLVLMATGWLTSAKPRLSLPTRVDLLAGIPVLVAGWFLATYLMPQMAFNIHDDLEKYFAYPVKMLATGTLTANPLASMGAETLGGQSFLHAFVAARFPLAYLGAVDSFFCLLLCVALAGYAIKPGPWALGALTAELAVLAINPQLVNISSLFSGTALMMAAVFLTGLPAAPGREEPSAAILGLLYAGLLTLKTTLVIFVGFHFLAVIAVGLWLGYRRVEWALRVVVWAILFTGPWLILNSPLYLAPARSTTPVLPGDAPAPLRLFSQEPLAYGATQLHYTGLALAGLLLAAFVLFATRRGWFRPSSPVTAVAAAGLATSLVYIVLVAGFGQLFFESGAATRYTCPVLIAVIPAILRLLEPLAENRRFRFLPLGAAGFGLAVIGAFLPSAVARITQIAQCGVPLAYFYRFPPKAKEENLDYNREVLSGALRSKLATIQALVPAGEPLGVWVMAPFWLDFKRNPILHTDPAGLTMRWAQMPADVNYFLLEYNGYAVRPDEQYITQMGAADLTDRILAGRTLAFLGDLRWRAGKSVISYNDGRYVLMRFDQR